MLSRLAGVLNEAVMGFLALAAPSLGTAPFLFELPPIVAQSFDVAEWVIIGLFAVEYAANLALSIDRRKFVLHPWRLLDAVIIVAALLAIVSTLALVPAVAGGLLGMNLGDSPWPVTLGEVAFGTLVLTLGVLYTFMAKGWLR